MKKKTIVPLIVFLVGICLLSVFTYNTNVQIQKDRRTIAKLNAVTYGQRIENDIENGIEITDTLKQLLINGNGQIINFSKVAENLMSYSIQSVQLAPNGVVTEIYPEEGNEAGKIDLLKDSKRGEISNYAKDYNITIIQGPIKLKQGGPGLVVRNPIYLEDKNGQEYFWGFTIAVLRVPEIFEDSTNALSKFKYNYRLSREASVLDKKYVEVDANCDKMIRPVTYNLTVGKEKWKLEIMPRAGWSNSTTLYLIFFGGLSLVILLTGLTIVLFLLDERRVELKELAHKDGLTKLYNRYGFDEMAEKMLSKNPKAHYVAAMLDVDDFKLINDMYGHAYGDKALISLSENMQKFFSSSALLGRNGGDEFCILLPNCTMEEVKESLIEFTKTPKTFSYKGQTYSFCISLGYAEYPNNAIERSQLMRCADTALYEVKLHGKNGCKAYQEGFQSGVRKQLGFVLNDISENLPGAFIIYRADKEDDEIFYANKEFLDMAGYENLDAFFNGTKKSFRNLIREDQQKAVETSIWNQIESGSKNDYIHYQLRRQDGTYIPVLDQGRIVESERFGRVFYVLFMDWQAMQSHYSEKFNAKDV
ncbi:diguanylate cyclase domain-containing protein [Holdemanella biformis]|uniref:diguanylate cyclase domain-containing protein n=1 Tax=Holdemanella biformis TaxID=1735 RepID=UPI002E796C81|nr:diguanylate cyclase [Holdemanella biformis]MEE0396343.1 diguanylate cyclase [Holdemanella biformis]